MGARRGSPNPDSGVMNEPKHEMHEIVQYQGKQCEIIGRTNYNAKNPIEKGWFYVLKMTDENGVVWRSSEYEVVSEQHLTPTRHLDHHRLDGPDLHPDAKTLADHLCGYASACVADAVIEYLSRIDCSPVCQDMIREYLQDKTHENQPTTPRNG